MALVSRSHTTLHLSPSLSIYRGNQEPRTAQCVHTSSQRIFPAVQCERCKVSHRFRLFPPAVCESSRGWTTLERHGRADLCGASNILGYNTHIFTLTARASGGWGDKRRTMPNETKRKKYVFPNILQLFFLVIILCVCVFAHFKARWFALIYAIFSPNLLSAPFKWWLGMALAYSGARLAEARTHRWPECIRIPLFPSVHSRPLSGVLGKWIASAEQ